MNIYLVRHGQTSWNRHQRLQGLSDIPLNRAGIRQSRRLAEWHRQTGVRLVVTSPLLRAHRTAQILAERNGTSPLVDDRLREIDHGPWTGLGLQTIADQFPDDFATWNSFPEKLLMSNGESLLAVYRRSAGTLVDLIRESFDQDVVIVSHGVVHALLLCAAMGAEPSRVREYSPHNAAVSALTVMRRKIIGVEREVDVTAK